MAGTVLKHANYSLLAVTTVMQYAHTYVSVAVRLLALRVINVRVHVRFHRAKKKLNSKKRQKLVYPPP